MGRRLAVRPTPAHMKSQGSFSGCHNRPQGAFSAWAYNSRSPPEGRLLPDKKEKVTRVTITMDQGWTPFTAANHIRRP